MNRQTVERQNIKKVDRIRMTNSRNAERQMYKDLECQTLENQNLNFWKDRPSKSGKRMSHSGKSERPTLERFRTSHSRNKTSKTEHQSLSNRTSNCRKP